MKLLVQGDDYGFTKGVTLGMLEGIDHGVLTCSGLFANMPDAEWAAAQMRARPDFCWGIDFNLVTGPCCADPRQIPHFVDVAGNFIRSGITVRDPRWQSEVGRRAMFPFEECYLEIRAQFDRYVKLVGKKPGYLNGHSINHENLTAAIRQLAREEALPYTNDILEQFHFAWAVDIGGNEATTKKIFDPARQVNRNPLQYFMDHADDYLKHEYVFAGGHPGYVDAALFSQTSLSIERCRDLEMVLSPVLKQWIKEHQVELISYADLI